MPYNGSSPDCGNIATESSCTKASGTTLYTMTKHCILNRIQHNNTAIRANYRYAQQHPEWENATVQTFEREERLQRLEQAICTLPVQKQQVVRMKRNGLSNEEIAERLHVSIHTIKSHYQESIKLLRARLRDLAVVLLFLLGCKG